MDSINPVPRPKGELAELKRIWATPTGWRLPSAVNNTVIGLFYIGIAFLFFLLAGVLAGYLSHRSRILEQGTEH